MKTQKKDENKDNVENRVWTMKNKSTNALMSPWHDLEIESTFDGDHCITGVIEMTASTLSKLECVKDVPYNPIMQDIVINKNTKLSTLRKFSKPSIFNYGFIPRTWSDNDRGGDGDPIDLVDLSWKEVKPTMAVSDYLVLGTIGLVD
jgi:inorganic pyrophosphatase